MKGNLKHVFQAMFMVLATVMLLSIPASAASSKTVATIGKKSYTSLEDAVKKVKDGQTIKLKKDVKTFGFTLNRNVKYTINLNGHKITKRGSDIAVLFIKKGTVTFKNGTVGCEVYVEPKAKVTFSSIKMQSKYKPSIEVKKKGKLTIKGGTYYAIDNFGTLSIKKGTYKGSVINWGTMKIAGGTFNGDNESLYNDGNVTISDGTFNITIGNEGTMKISGGTFKLKSTYNPESFISNSRGTMTISGGKFTSSCPEATIVNGSNVGCTLKISGGTIKNTRTKLVYGHGVPSAVLNYSTFKMTGGTVQGSCSSGYALYNWGGKATISGGSLKNSGAYKVYNTSGASLKYSGSVLKESQINRG